MDFDDDIGSADLDVEHEDEVNSLPDETPADSDDVSELSALQASIKRKGQNSYYYAHEHKADAPAWDGSSEPRLLHRIESREQAPRVESITSYAWADGKKKVTIYITYEGAGDVPDDVIELASTATSINFTIKQSATVHKTLLIPRLHDEIEEATYKKKTDKFVISLKKTKEFTWYELKKSG